MLNPGDIIQIKEFKLKSGEVKDKFLITLTRQTNGSLVYLSFTTSKQYIQPEDIHPGCISKGVKHMYLFPAGHIVGENGFSFWKDTFIQTFDNIIEVSERNLNTEYTEGKIIVLDCLTRKYYFDMVYCLYKSPHIKLKYRPLLQAIMEGMNQ